jgi:hydrogenase expression/formation protein HypE
VAVTGARPRWFLSVVLVPPGTTEDAVEELFRSIRDALTRIGAHLVGGHTEVTPAVTRPVVVGQMLGVAESRLVTTGGCTPGDSVVQVRPAPIEGAAVLARAAGDVAVPPSLLEEARAALDRPGVSVVEPALHATELGATSLHDPTEGGLAGGLHEVARAEGHGIEVDRDAVLWFPPGVAVCTALGADPWCTLASGTLLATFPPSAVEHALRGLERAGHQAAVIGRVVENGGVTDRHGTPIPWPDRDEVARLLSEEEPAKDAATI